MEQRKTLWIIAAVSVFLLVVLGFALIFSQTSSKTIQTSTSIIPVEKNTNYADGWTLPSTNTETVVKKDENEAANDGSVQVKDMFVVSENTTVFDLNQNGTTIDLNTLKNQYVSENQNQETSSLPPVENTNVVVKKEVEQNTQNTSQPKVQTALEAEKQEKASSVKQVEQKTSGATKQTASSPSSTVKSSTSSTTSKTTQTTKASTTTSTTQKAVETKYWVQVASYSNKKTAENSRAILLDNKISSDIYTYQDGEKLYYRVRVGPYVTKSEAEYWMAKITQISDFSKAGSYVTVTNN